MTTQLLHPYPYYEYTEDDPEMADLGAQHDLAIYLEDLLKLLYTEQGWYVIGNMYILERPNPRIAPDVFMAKVDIPQDQRPYVGSWDLSEPNRPVPAIVFEVASDETFPKDLDEKINRYQQMGVQEYFAYDPTLPRPIWHEKDVRLKGWKFVNKVRHAPLSHPDPTKKDWLWSEVLQRWLVPAGHELHLYDANGKRELTREELRQFLAKRVEEEADRAERERDAREAAELRAEQLEKEREAERLKVEQLEKERLADQQAREAEQQRIIQLEKEREAERLKVEQLEKEQQAAEQKEAALRRKLIEQGLNPDDFL
jgi:Uma2 family endonuclease